MPDATPFIETGIPMPKPRKYTAKWILAIEAMKVGDSMVVTDNEAKALYHCGHGRGITIVRKTLEDGRVRVWRAD